MKEKYVSILSKYLPQSSVDQITEWIIFYGVHLNITKERTTKLGDFRPSKSTRGHKITINYNLNPYAFLLTLVHEFAHLETWNAYKNSARPHGLEWKRSFVRHMEPFLNEETFPLEVLIVIKSYLSNPAASSCSDENLTRSLRRFDAKPVTYLEELSSNAVFRLQTGRVFRKGQQKRKHFLCTELTTNKLYLISPLAEVELIG